MTIEEKLALIEETLDAKEGTLKMETCLSGVAEYDSMTKLGLIIMMEDEFGVKLSGNMIKEFKTVGDIVNLMNK